MKKYTGKNLDIILNKIALEQNVNVEDIQYKVLGTSGFSIFAKTEIEAYTENDCIESMKKYISDVLIALGFEVKSLEVNKDYNDYNINIDTDNNSLVIGFNGKNLNSLETLVRQVLSNEYKRRFNIHLDVNNYFLDKEKKLKGFARRIAAEVGRTKMDMKLDPMPNYDRKVIHEALKDIHYVNTKSYGIGKNRYLIVHYDEENDIKVNEANKANKQRKSRSNERKTRHDRNHVSLNYQDDNRPVAKREDIILKAVDECE
jgi:spoIIIJ-associated protein